MVEIRTRVKWKKWDLLNYFRNEGRGDKGEWWRGWTQIWYSVRTLVNVTMCPQYNSNKIKMLERVFLCISCLIHFSWWLLWHGAVCIPCFCDCWLVIGTSFLHLGNSSQFRQGLCPPIEAEGPGTHCPSCPCSKGAGMWPGFGQLHMSTLGCCLRKLSCKGRSWETECLF
jgi:hypothetical protein